MTGVVESVNVGTTRPVPWGSLKRSAIDKRPVEGPVRVATLGLEPDEIADLGNHGGVDQAVYAFAAEDLEVWAAELGRPIPPGGFGENLTTRGIDLNEARIGERWQIGTAVLEVATVRIPCSVFAGFIDQPRWVRRFTEAGRPGAYLRVVREGVIESGDAVQIVEERAHHVTIGLTFRALTTERSLLPRLLEEPRVAEEARKRAERYGARKP
ncbi:MOSC domain-containing protein [Solicola gregarius]|uniref:MOSC domain-containing protein n=1 Tax=Solicola gregarius TaxID=2908642 RepID=A0AA46TJS4_9ACTN|nr:MOSC domain-containing protein [Solicola gregarius]UYM05753.1 MOSC domain-containing protein [Solicola gregarius]